MDEIEVSISGGGKLESRKPAGLTGSGKEYASTPSGGCRTGMRGCGRESERLFSFFYMGGKTRKQGNKNRAGFQPKKTTGGPLYGSYMMCALYDNNRYNYRSGD